MKLRFSTLILYCRCERESVGSSAWWQVQCSINDVCRFDPRNVRTHHVPTLNQTIRCTTLTWPTENADTYTSTALSSMPLTCAGTLHLLAHSTYNQSPTSRSRLPSTSSKHSATDSIRYLRSSPSCGCEYMNIVQNKPVHIDRMKRL